MISRPELTPRDQQLQALCGLTTPVFDHLLAASTPVLLARRAARAARPGRQRAVGGGRKRRLTVAQELLLTLLDLRHNVAHAVVGALFGVSADTGENTFQEVVQVLREVCPTTRWETEKRWRKDQPSWGPTEPECLLIATFETPVRRPSRDEAQRRVYSGKKKRPTLKTQVVTDAQGELLEIDPGHRGPRHDRTLDLESGVAAHYPHTPKYADWSYRGTPDLHLPHRKPPGGELIPEQREENRRHASLRVSVEHGIRRLKSFRILCEEYRLALGRFPQIACVVVGLVHLLRIVGAASS